ncbi:Sre G protein-coupled chemoreceptor [Ancylostoma caninum]|uniref:Sre G protein-coupled chemoreceptor n=1 Tax=Ancylostoma caninum TaxID=29170 RepID=A0A368FJJ7_ANCCA|nr:Sre G protein-coupled chemoreceptor [Ancylostoma caninum]
MDYSEKDVPYETTMLFLATSHARIFCGALALCSLLGVVVERLCATYYLADYEHKKRLYIPIVIIEILLLNAIFSTVTYHSFGSTAPHGLAYLLCNLFAVAGNTVNNRLNRKYYSNTSRISTTVGRYTLAERYQISENICTSKALRDTFYLVPFFNALCLVAIFIDNFDVGIAAKNLSSVCLNFAALIYALLVPLVLLLHKKNLRRECEKLLKGVSLVVIVIQM